MVPISFSVPIDVTTPMNFPEVAGVPPQHMQRFCEMTESAATDSRVLVAGTDSPVREDLSILRFVERN
jgi:hypothetical protein